MSELALRVALIAIRRITTEEGVLEIVDAALSGPDDPPKKALSAKERQQRRRDKTKHSNGDALALGVTGNVTEDVTNVTGRVTENVTENVTRGVTRGVPRLAREEIQDSLSFSDDSENSERESVRAGERQSDVRVTASSRQTSRTGVTVLSPPLGPRETAERYVEPTDKLTEELRAIAAGATGAVAVMDVEGAWLKFCGHHAGKWLHIAGAWQMWCVREAQRERRDRDVAHTGPAVDEVARKRAAQADAEQRQRAHVAKLLRGQSGPRKVGE